MTMYMVAVAILLVPLLWFGINYARIMGGQGEQKTAIEAAALAAAHDVSRIVIDTPQFGYVSATDSAPVGTNTPAGDQFYMPVHGINSLIGTARLDLVIATSLGDPVMTALAQQDQANAVIVAQKYLAPVLSAAAQGPAVAIASPPMPPGSPPGMPWPPADWPSDTSQLKDINGATIDINADAVAAYTSNAIRLTDNSSYNPGSMKLTMGYLKTGLATNITIPQPSATYASDIPPASQQKNHYLSDTDIPFAGTDFVFAAVGSSPALIGLTNFQPSTTPSPLPYTIPVVVKAEADQMMATTQTTNGQTFHSAACAIPANTYDPKPAPGALSFSFPDGPYPGLNGPADLLSADPKLNLSNTNMTFDTSTGGDYPTPGASLGVGTSPLSAIAGANPTICNTWRVCIYDWLRRAGTNANAQAAVDMLSAASAAYTPFHLDTASGGPGNCANGQRDWIGGLINLGPPYPSTPAYTAPSWEDVTQGWGPYTGGPQIPVGMMHFYEFAPNGTIQYYYKYITPYPYAVLSHNQLYAEAVSNNGACNPQWPGGGPNAAFPPGPSQLTFKNVPLPPPSTQKGDINIQPQFDVYVRDEVRQPGLILGGNHGGEPLDNSTEGNPAGSATTISWAPAAFGHWGEHGSSVCFEGGGGGFGAAPPPPPPPPPPAPPPGGGGNGTPPLLGQQNDFGLSLLGIPAPARNVDPTLSAYIKYSQPPGPAGFVRPTYQTNGTAVDIRFRRVIQLNGGWNGYFYGFTKVGYLASEPPGPTPP